MTKPKHSPLPWRLGEDCPVEVCDNNGNHLAILDDADAALVVAAVNSHDDLLAAAKTLEQVIKYEIAKCKREGDIEGANVKAITLNMTLAAIAKAEGHSP